MMTAKKLKIAYLLLGGRIPRMESGKAFPREFFYGVQHLRDMGHDVDILEQAGLAGNLDRTRWISGLWWRFTIWLAGADLSAGFRIRSNGGLKKLNEYDTIIVLGLTVTLALGILKRLGLLKPRVVVLVMGLVPENAPWRRRVLYRWILADLRLCPVSKGEERFLRDFLGANADIVYLPFGVDSDFWISEEDGSGTAANGSMGLPYVFSIGNDANRDYQTLIDAWKPQYPFLKIVTSRQVRTGKENIEIIPGDWGREIFSDQEIRGLFQNALFCIIPLKPTIQPSGQSAALQAMACGKVVVLTRVAGLWDSERMIDEENCMLVEPGRPDLIQGAVETLCGNPDKVAEIGFQARRTVTETFSEQIMASHLTSIIGAEHAEDSGKPPHTEEMRLGK